ncbi:uncharacterized protein [Parasteatoda tepidariorum]|uniref:uncharacterized protein n=1 Tax=Parasteatoda tepidariorum TaxID=114398 RepID=UPI00077FB7AA|nr:nudix hydrolase 8-like [Parasteatoda tepidariorum]
MSVKFLSHFFYSCLGNGFNKTGRFYFPLKYQRSISMTTNAPISYSVFEIEQDIYKGVTVKTHDLVLSDTEFEKSLSDSLTNWINIGIRGVWFKVNLEKSSYIPILVKHGFSFHHAKTSYVMLTRWLPGDEPNLLPQYPHTHIGVGGMVINDKNEVLTIQERFNVKPYWKLPGGYSNPGEDFAHTAQREVFEETGIETEFKSVVALRHHHQHIFNCSDIYVVCYLRPLNLNIIKSKDEIAKCEWMNVETYRTHPEVTDFNRFIMNTFLESQNMKHAIISSPILSYKKDRYDKVYHVQPINESKS